MVPLGNARRRASVTSRGSRRGLCRISLSSPRSEDSRSSNDEGYFSLLYCYELWQDRGETTVNSINTNTKWFLLGFTHVTGTEIYEDRAEVYKVSAPSYKRGGSHLIVSSKSR